MSKLTWDEGLSKMDVAVISSAADILKIVGRYDDEAKAAYDALAKWMRLG